MKMFLGFVVGAQLLAASIGFAASGKNYQVTGPIVSLTDTTIIVQKGDEQWEIARDAKTKTDSPLKVGEKVTIHYRMVATTVDVKTTGTLSEPAVKSSARPPGAEKPLAKSAADKAATQ